MSETVEQLGRSGPIKGAELHARYAVWKRFGPHLAEYACEFAGTAWLMFAIVATVSLMFSTASPVHHWIPSNVARLFCAGALIGTSGSLFTISAWGKLSGAHLNPAMSLGFAVLGKMHLRDLAGYIVAQMSGAVVGSVAAKLILGIPAAQINQAALRQPASVSEAACLLGECLATFAYCYAIYYFVSHKEIMRWTPLLNIPLAASIVCLDGNISGAGFNPARWFGPAALTCGWQEWWIWALAPMGAAAFAALMRKAAPLATHMIPQTAKLFHDTRFRSIFVRDTVPSTPPDAL